MSWNVQEKNPTPILRSFLSGWLPFGISAKRLCDFLEGKLPSPPFPFWHRADLAHYLEKEWEKINTGHNALIRIEQICIWWTSML